MRDTYADPAKLAFPEIPFDVRLMGRTPARELGDLDMRRALPSSKRQMVDPFFFDQMGPAECLTDQSFDVGGMFEPMWITGKLATASETRRTPPCLS